RRPGGGPGAGRDRGDGGGAAAVGERRLLPWAGKKERHSLLTVGQPRNFNLKASGTAGSHEGGPMDAAKRPAEINPGKLTGLFKKQFQLCKVKPGETIAIVSDLGTRIEYIHAAFAAADELGADIYEM